MADDAVHDGLRHADPASRSSTGDVVEDDSFEVVEVHKDGVAGSRDAAAGDGVVVEEGMVHNYRKESWGDSSWVVLGERRKGVVAASKVVEVHILQQDQAGNKLRFEGDRDGHPRWFQHGTTLDRPRRLHQEVLSRTGEGLEAMLVLWLTSG